MKKYLIKETCVATETNINFKGETKVYYIGKGSTETHEKFINWFINDYGYSTKAAVCRALKSRMELSKWYENNYGYWKSTFEIIEMEVKQ